MDYVNPSKLKRRNDRIRSQASLIVAAYLPFLMR